MLAIYNEPQLYEALKIWLLVTYSCSQNNVCLVLHCSSVWLAMVFRINNVSK